MPSLAEWAEKSEAVRYDVKHQDRFIFDLCDECHGLHAYQNNAQCNGKSLLTFIGNERFCTTCLLDVLASYRVNQTKALGRTAPSSDIRYDGPGYTFPNRGG